MKSFEDWFKELTSDTLWYELLRAYKDETIKKAGERVFASLVADGTVEARPMSENRKHVYNILIKNPGDKKTTIDWVKAALENGIAKKEDVISNPPLTGEERMQRLKEWEAIVKGSTMANSMPKPSYKQLAEEGGVLPPKPAPYPCTSPIEAYIKERHIAYLLANYDPRTREKLPGFQEESEWNTEYDSKHVTIKGL